MYRKYLTPGGAAVLVLAALALVFGGASWNLGYWVHGAPGAGLLPLGGSLLLAAVSVFLWHSEPVDEEDSRFSFASLRGFALICAYGVSLPYGGVVLPSIAFAAAWMRILHARPTISSLAISTCIVVVATFLFERLLGLPIPLWPELG